MTTTTSTSEAIQKNPYKAFRDADVLWPPDCPDDILAKVIDEAKRLYADNKDDSQRVKIADGLKKFCDENWKPYWHVFIGKSFGCYCTHEKRRYIYFTLDHQKLAFLIYKS